MPHGQYGFADASLPRKQTRSLIGNGENLRFFLELRSLIGAFENETAGHRPANADRQPALLARAAIRRSRPSSPSPCGSRPCGLRSGAGRYGRSPMPTAASILGRATLFACRGAGVRAYLSMPFYAAFQAPCVASGGTRGRALWALKQKTGPVGLRFPPLRGGASVFQLAPRYPPSASWGLRRRLRRGWKGGAGHRFPRP